MKKIISAVLITSFFIGCGTKIEMKNYPVRVKASNLVPEVCKNEYSMLKDKPSIAVLPFQNNTSYGVASVSSSTERVKAGAGIGITKYGIGVGVSSDNGKSNAKRVLDPKLDKAITSSLEGMIVELGGANLYSRGDLEKIIKEQKLQGSGLIDEKTMVEIGKLKGVKYIVTGSIDSVTKKYVDYKKVAGAVTDFNKAKDDKIKLSTLLVNSVLTTTAEMTSGMKITTAVTFKVIEVETGKILFSTKTKATTNIGDNRNPSYEEIVSGIKADLVEAVQNVKKDFANYFDVAGYIVQVKSDKDSENFIAQISLGSKDKIRPEQKFVVYKFEEIIDPVAKKAICDKTTLDVTLTISKNHLEKNRAWAVAEGDEVGELRAGQIVKRIGD